MTNARAHTTVNDSQHRAQRLTRALVLALVASAGLAFDAHVARAETVILLPPSGDASLSRQRMSAHAAVTHALDAQGARTVSHAAAVEAAGGGALADCRTLDCAPQLVRAAEADLAVSVAVADEASDATADDASAASDLDAEPERVVRVTLVDSEGNRFPGRAVVQLGELASAARDALLDARALQLLGPGPWLHAQSTPQGAELWLDGEKRGVTPMRMRIKPGRHTLELRMTDYRSHVQRLDVAKLGGRVHGVEVELHARDGARPSPEADAELSARAIDDTDDGATTTTHPIVGPAILATLGAALLTYDVVSIATAGCERVEPTGTCTERSEVNTGAALAVAGVGVGAIAGAVLWYVLGAEEQPAEVSARISPRGLELHGRF